MDESELFFLVGLICPLIIWGVLTVFERAILKASRSKLAEKLKDERKKALLNFLLLEEARVVSLVSLGKSLFLAVFTACLVFFALELSLKLPGILLLFLAALLVIFLLQTYIWVWAKGKPEDLLIRLFPLAAFSASCLNLKGRIFPPEEKSRETSPGEEESPAYQPTLTEEDIKMMVEAGQEHGVLEDDETEMIHSIFQFGDTIAKEVMVPRVDIIMIKADSPICEALDLGIKHGFSKFPVYEENGDNIIGILHLKDLLTAFKEKRLDSPLKDYIRPATFIPGTKKIDELLKEMQQKKISTVIVVDEFGGTDGFITLENLIEEIVGEIIDEMDIESPELEALPDGSFRVDAKKNIEDFSEETEIKIPAGEYETVGGYVYSLLGRVPREGETLESSEYSIKVESLQRHRIKKLRFYRKKPVEKNGADL